MLLKAECVAQGKNLLSKSRDIGHAAKSNQSQCYFFKGVISTTRADLDREHQSTYEIIVKAKDAPGSSGDSSTATVIITLTDINDNFPVFKHRKYNASAVSVGNQGLT